MTKKNTYFIPLGEVQYDKLHTNKNNQLNINISLLLAQYIEKTLVYKEE